MRVCRIGIFWNPEKPNAVCSASRLARAFLSRDVAVCADERLCREMGIEAVEEDRGFERCDLLAVLGGDGTLIGALETAVPLNLPLLGVNLGRMGFLTETEPETLELAVEAVASGRFALEERMLLSAETPSNACCTALNEIAVLRKPESVGVAEVEVRCNGALVDRIAGDGVLIASPTGSTAYALAAGGPIVAPGLDCLVMTPVCAHSLRSRPYVLPPDSVIEIRPTGVRGGAAVRADGKPVGDIAPGERVTIRRAERSAVFVRVYKRAFFDLLRQKFAEWSQE